MASCVHIARLDFYASSFTPKVTLLSWGTEISFHPQSYMKAAVKIFSQEFVLFLRCHLVSGQFAWKDGVGGQYHMLYPSGPCSKSSIAPRLE